MRPARQVLRVLGVLCVAAAVVDPGCTVNRRPRLEVVVVGNLPDAIGTRMIGRVAAGAPWADVVDASRPVAAADTAPTPAARIVIGDAVPVLRAVRARPAALTVRADDPALGLAWVGAPARVVAGLQAAVAVHVDGVPPGSGRVRISLRDESSNLERGHLDVDAAAATNGRLQADVPWLATRVGPSRLLVEAAYAAASGDGRSLPSEGVAPGVVRPATPVTVPVDVLPPELAVAVLEARPAWGARFARLAVADIDRLRLTTEVRTSPGVVVRTASSSADRPTPASDPAVWLVGGVEALTPADVTRLERAARDSGRAVVLLLDGEPGSGPWRRLWPGPTGRMRSAARPIWGHLAGHRWKLREWLEPILSTGVVPLAYLDSGSVPFIAGRALGAGRVVLVGALDAWRWRADADVEFEAGWRAIIQRLAADVPPPVEVISWATGPLARTLHVEVRLRPDVASRAGMVVRAITDATGEQPLPLVRLAEGRWRGAMRIPRVSSPRVDVDVRDGTEVVGQVRTVVDAAPPAAPGSWEDVVRHQAGLGALAADASSLPRTLEALRGRLALRAVGPWHPTRTVWFAALALTLLGAEWMLRRLHGER